MREISWLTKELSFQIGLYYTPRSYFVGYLVNQSEMFVVCLYLSVCRLLHHIPWYWEENWLHPGRTARLTVLYCTVLCCVVLYCTVLYCTVLYCTVLCCTVLYCNVLRCAVLYCAVLYCAVLCCAVLYCTVLYCAVLCISMQNFTVMKPPYLSSKRL